MPPVEFVDLIGKSVAVIGANAGIAVEVSRENVYALIIRSIDCHSPLGLQQTSEGGRHRVCRGSTS